MNKKVPQIEKSLRDGEANRPPKRGIRFGEVFSLQLLVIFTTELAVMDIGAPLFGYLHPVSAALLDATLLVLFSFIPLWILFSPVIAGRGARYAEIKRTAFQTLFKLIATFFIYEFIVMLLLSREWSDLHPLLLGVVDAAVITLLTAPLLWGLLNRLVEKHQQILLIDLLENPLLLYWLLLFVIFIADLLQALLVPNDWALPGHGSFHLVDALTLTLIIAPFLWFFVIRPLRRSVETTKDWARAIYEQVIDAIVLTDSFGQIVSLNPSAERIFGYTNDELAGQPAQGLFDATSQSLDPLFREVSEQETGASREMIGRNRQGALLTVDVSVSRIFLGGREEFLLIIRDTSERNQAVRALRESEVRFREIFDQSEDAIFFLKPQSIYVIEANSTAEKLFGYRKVDLQGDSLPRIFSEGKAASLQHQLATMKQNDTLHLDQLIAKRDNGTVCIVSLRAKIMTLHGVEVIYCTLRDITERVHLEREAREIQSRLIQANKMTSLGLLVSGVAHEINNPNEYIMASAQLFARCWADSRKVLHEYYLENGDFLIGGLPFSKFDDHADQLLSGILDGSRRINAIIGTLKQFARQNQAENSTLIDINQVISSAITILQHEIGRYTEHFQCELAEGLPLAIGNSQQLSQVVINLLMNACQALPQRDRGIRIASGFEPDSAMVTITVEDEGCGIALEDHNQVMEPFFTTKLDSGGTGLGLSICHSIVAEHGGTLMFTSAPNQGAVFTIRIPASQKDSQDR